MTSPLRGLFPERNNYDNFPNSSSRRSIGSEMGGGNFERVSGGADNKILNNADHSIPSSRQAQNSGSPRNSTESNILKSIIHEELKEGYSQLKDRLKSDRFYLSNRFKTKQGVSEGAETPTDEGSEVYFKTYDRKVENEYALRDRMNKLLDEMSSRPIKILNNDDLNDIFVGGHEQIDIKKPGKWGKICKILRENKNKGIQNISVYSSSKEDDTNSNETHIIDLDKNIRWERNEYNYNNSSKRMLKEKWDPFLITTSSNVLTSSYNKFKSSTNQQISMSMKRSQKYHVQRKLTARHLQMIAIGASLGVGLYLTSGKAFSVAGPLGTLIGFSICGSICLATMLSFTELSTLIPISSGFSGLASRFVEDAFGFALGWSYWISFTIALPSQIVASIFMISYYSPDWTTTVKSTLIFVTVFWIYVTAVNLLDVRFFGEIIYTSTLFKLLITIIMMFAMFVLNLGGRNTRVGFRFWDSSKSPPGLTYGLFRPTFDLMDTGQGSLNGIHGIKGNVLSVVLVVLISTFSFSGVEMAFVASGEAINPRRTLPAATKRTFAQIIPIYILAILFAGLNIYSGDSRLLRYFPPTHNPVNMSSEDIQWQIENTCTGDKIYNLGASNNGNKSPWVIALQSFGLCTFASAFNGILIFFGVSAACSSLFASSRTLYSMATQEKAPRIFQTCNHYGVPWVAVLFSSAFGVIAYLAVNEACYRNFQTLSNLASATIAIIWCGLNVSFLRFYFALKRRPDIISRDDPNFPYKSPFQPYLSLYGLIGSTLVVFFMGFTNFIDGFWSTRSFVSSYGGLILFIACYASYKTFGTSKIQRLDQLDMDTGRREMDRMIWDEHRQYSGSIGEKLRNLVTWWF
ncbi:Ssy1p Ecym_4230 [Eremothecium cymbalariae DBVPG|uniref:Amino acid permease/ SLC12A domain-containing protein n=1 Tax=Eremothecium cymbalariae (strain CBS 270.75 / DBVPG 7215 / KCTC 17166 / NRRL Y-17582) TaxID=931890 RepID=G8JTE4_ERECY|nr:hypothetical protein Ecym_4230 [Eremothecium cymbalariae DBVPG\